MRRAGWLLVAGFALFAGRVQAQGNDSSAPTGGRSALMGNTGVALARDGAAPFYNPAAIVRIRDEQLAFSVDFYSLSLMHMAAFHQPRGVDGTLFGGNNLGGTGLVDTAFRILPSTLCLFFTLKQLAELGGSQAETNPDPPEPDSKLAICFASLESEDVDDQAISFHGMTTAGPTSQIQSMQRRWNRTYVGPTYSTHLSSRLAVGASLQGVYSYNSFGIDSSSVSSKFGGGALASALGTSGSGFSFELTAVLGATYRYRTFTLGASVRVPSLHLFGAYRGALYRSTAGGDSDAALLTSARGSMRTAPPIRIALGGGFVWQKFTLEIDAAVDIPIDDAITGSVTEMTSDSSKTPLLPTNSHATYAVANRATLNPSIGAEYFLSPTFSMLFGVSTNFSSLARLDAAQSVGNLVQAREHHIDASLGLGSYWQGAELLFGFRFDYGWGQSLVADPYVIPNDWAVIAMQSYSLTFVISGATDLRQIVHVLQRITEGDAADNPTDSKPSQTTAMPPPEPHKSLR